LGFRLEQIDELINSPFLMMLAKVGTECLIVVNIPFIAGSAEYPDLKGLSSG
jgi:hypothetical protein